MLIPVAEVIGLNFVIQNENPLGKHVLTIASQIGWESLLVEAKNYKANMAQDEFFGFCLMAFLRLRYKASFFSEG